MKYKPYTLHNFKEIPQIQKLSKQTILEIETISRIFPLRTNNYIVEHLIDWENWQEDPLFIMHFPLKAMLLSGHFSMIETALHDGASKSEIDSLVRKIHAELNPHPAGQAKYNIPVSENRHIHGMQHKYNETLLVFPAHGQSCQAYCTFCFRWPQFTKIPDFRFALHDIQSMISYLKKNPLISDVLFTGGDPMIMNIKYLKEYIEPILEADLPHVRTIRIGTKSLAHWPFRFLTDPDATEVLQLFEKVTQAKKNLAFMAHFSHPRELETEAVQEASYKILKTGAQIRTQSPILNHINNEAGLWHAMWRKQVDLGMTPYYMFVPRNTGNHKYFEVSLIEAWNVFRKAYSNVSGICRTVRGPIMSSDPGKIHIVGVAEINQQKVIVLNFVQGRNPDWNCKPFFAEYNESAAWLDDLKPAFGQKEFFYQEQLNRIYDKLTP